ncbi:MAG TPA: response regulator [Opitutaceae bacterium]|jgi:CheY-like chemotaxis protein|nr:response regulator [Opitutaceae bacterium]
MNAKVLIVDDSSLARRTMRAALEGLGCSVDAAKDGAEGLERFCVDPPELVILDMVMTGMYGLEVLGKMRELKPDVKVIIATADIQQSTAEQVRSAGAKGILNKPINSDKLKAAIEAIMAGGETWN